MNTAKARVAGTMPVSGFYGFVSDTAGLKKIPQADR